MNARIDGTKFYFTFESFVIFVCVVVDRPHGSKRPALAPVNDD